jgi:hypothetical protein
VQTQWQRQQQICKRWQQKRHHWRLLQACMRLRQQLQQVPRVAVTPAAAAAALLLRW